MCCYTFVQNAKGLNLQTRNLKEGDITTVNDWLEGWGKLRLEEAMYPKTGKVLYDSDSGEMYYMGFVWIPETSNMAMTGFITRNPFVKTRLPRDARYNFNLALVNYCKELGKDVVITWTDNPFLVGDYKAMGFAETSDRCSELIAKIQ